MKPLIELLEEERMLMLKQDTIHQNMLRYHGPDAHEILQARKKFVNQDLINVRNEIRKYITELFNGSDQL